MTNIETTNGLRRSKKDKGLLGGLIASIIIAFIFLKGKVNSLFSGLTKSKNSKPKNSKPKKVSWKKHFFKKEMKGGLLAALVMGFIFLIVSYQDTNALDAQEKVIEKEVVVTQALGEIEFDENGKLFIENSRNIKDLSEDQLKALSEMGFIVSSVEEIEDPSATVNPLAQTIASPTTNTTFVEPTPNVVQTETVVEVIEVPVTVIEVVEVPVVEIVEVPVEVPVTVTEVVEVPVTVIEVVEVPVTVIEVVEVPVVEIVEIEVPVQPEQPTEPIVTVPVQPEQPTEPIVTVPVQPEQPTEPETPTGGETTWKDDVPTQGRR